MSKASVPTPARFRRRIALAPLLLAFLAVLSTVARGQETEVRQLGNFDEGMNGWTYYGGWEFPGASGTLKPASQEKQNNLVPACLHGDFTKGGSYVAMRRALKSTVHKIGFWVKSANANGLTVRLEDESGQTFQHKLHLQKGGEWQQITLAEERFPKAEHWGGKNDGTWHGKMKTLWIMYCSFMLDGKAKKGDLFVTDIRVLADKKIIIPPRPMPKDDHGSPTSMFGFSGHMMHSDAFYGDKFSYHWRLEYTLPWVMEGHFGWMREPLYQPWFGNPKSKGCQRNRKLIDTYLTMYDHSGVKVLLCPMFDKVGHPGFQHFMEWIGDMAKKHASVRAIEMHNEPNLRFFWHGTAKEYAAACVKGAQLVKTRAPQTKIVIGSISHLWWGPGVQFLQTALVSGGMDVADGISAHPYRKSSAPEGGSMHARPKDPCGFEKEVRDFWALVQRYNTAGKPLGLYFTEFGYSSGKGQSGVADQVVGVESTERQADYNARLMRILFDLRLRGIPIEGCYLYDLKNDHSNPNSMEGNFGSIAYDAQSAKPSYTAYSRIATMFHNPAAWEAVDLARTFAAPTDVVKSYTWRRLSDGALVLAYWRMNQLQKKDEDFTAAVKLQLPQGFQLGRAVLHDLYAKEPAPIGVDVAAGQALLKTTVKARTSYIVLHAKDAKAIEVGAVPWQHTLPATFTVPGATASVTLTGKRQAAFGDPIALQLRIDNAKNAKPLTGAISLMGKQTPFRAEARQPATLDLALPAATQTETRMGYFHVLVGNHPIGRGDFVVQVKDPISVVGRPMLDKDGNIQVYLRNEAQTTTYQPTVLEWAVIGRGGKAELNTPLKPKQIQVYRALVGTVEPFTMQSIQATMHIKGRAPLRINGKMGYSPCHRLTCKPDADLGEWAGRAAIDLGKASKHVRDYGGAEDLSGRVWLGHDDSALYLGAEITDDTHAQAAVGANIWQGDSIQFACAPAAAEGVPQWHEFGLALTSKGPQVWRWIAPDGVATGSVAAARVAITRQGTTTRYEIAIPWQQLQRLSPADRGMLFSVLVNENDGKGRRGWVEWGSGLGADKTPAKFRYLALQQE